MRLNKVSRFWYVGLTAILIVGVLVGCSGGEATQTVASVGGDAYTSEVLDTSYDDALNASDQLLLGTLQLEGTEQAVTPEQAATLLPLWRGMQGGVTAQTEVNALLKQIERTMTQEQLQAIAAMQLTQEDMRTWMEEQGMGMGGGFPGAGDMSEEERANLRATAEAGGGVPGGGSFGNLSEEERANMRATMEAGGMPGGGPFGNLSEEERANMRATMEAGGGMPGGPGGGAGGRQFGPLLNPLLELLEARAGEA